MWQVAGGLEFMGMEAFYGVIGVIVGSLSSLIGVVISLRWNQKIHESNLQEERRKRKEDREFAAKQTAFLAASEALVRFLNYYLSLADRVLPSDGKVAEEVTELGIAMNRLHFYCSIETIERSLRLNQILGEAFSEVIKAKMASGFTNEDLKVVDFQLSTLEKMNTNIQEEIKSILQCDPQNSLVISHRKQLSQNFQTIASLYEKRVNLVKQKYIETEKCRDVFSKNLKSIYAEAGEFLLLARQELSFPIDPEKYKVLIGEQIESTRQHLEQFMAEIRKQVLARMQC